MMQVMYLFSLHDHSYFALSILDSKSRGKLEPQESFNLHDELMKHLHFGKKEKRNIVCELVNESQFIFIFSCFQNYEVSEY